MVKVICNNCEHEWNYKGSSRFYITCPRCYSKINIYKIKTTKQEEENDGGNVQEETDSF